MEFKFNGKDVSNTTIISPYDNSVQFTVATDNVDGKQTTTIWYGQKASAAAMIRWKDRTFEIHGVQHAFDQVKLATNMLACLDDNLEREWKWYGTSYDVKWKHKTWEIKAKPTKTLVASFKSYRSHLFHDDEPMTGRIQPHALQNTLFFIMVFVYSETKRVKDKKQETEIITEVLSSA